MMFGRFPRSPSTTTPYLHITTTITSITISTIIIIIIIIIIITSLSLYYCKLFCHRRRAILWKNSPCIVADLGRFYKEGSTPAPSHPLSSPHHPVPFLPFSFSLPPFLSAPLFPPFPPLLRGKWAPIPARGSGTHCTLCQCRLRWSYGHNSICLIFHTQQTHLMATMYIRFV